MVHKCKSRPYGESKVWKILLKAELNRKWSLYRYVYNNHLQYIDPDGTCTYILKIPVKKQIIQYFPFLMI